MKKTLLFIRKLFTTVDNNKSAPAGRWSVTELAHQPLPKTSSSPVKKSRFPLMLAALLMLGNMAFARPFPVDTIAGAKSVCSGNSTQLSYSSSGGTWSTGDPSVTSIDPFTGLVFGVGAGTDIITYQVNSDISVTMPFTVDATPGPITGSLTTCVGFPTRLGNSAFTGVWSSSNTSVATLYQIVPGLVTGAAPGTSVITFTNSCGVATTTITVFGAPSAAPVNNGFMCVGGSVQMFATPGNQADQYTWTGPGGFNSTDQNPVVAPSGTSVYSLTVGSSVTGCPSNTVYTTIVTVNPQPSAAPSNNGGTCGIISVTLTANPLLGADMFSWSGPGGYTSSVQNPVITPVVAGVYSLTVSNGGRSGCSSSTVFTTTIAAGGTPPVGTYNISPMPVCAGTTASLIATYSTCAGNGLSFGGVLSNSSAKHTGVVTTATNNLTIEAWIKWNGQGGSQVIIQNGGGGAIGSPSGYAMTMESGVIKCWLNGVTTMVASGTVTSGQWTHLAFVRSSGTWSYYRNGVNFALTNSTSTPLTPAGYFTVGSLEDGITSTFDGIIDEVKIWTVARNATQVNADKNACSSSAQAGLAGYWSFNELTGTTAADGSGNGNDLTVTNTSWVESGAVPNTYVFWPGEGSFQSGAATQIHTYNTAGVYSTSVTVTAGNGCTTKVLLPLTVLTTPGTITGNLNICTGAGTTLSNPTAGGTWSVFNSSIAFISQSGVVTSLSAGSTAITYSTGCGNAATAVLNVTDPVTGNFSVTPNPMCAGTTATLSAAYNNCTGTAAVFGGVLSNSAAIHAGPVTTAINNLTIEAWVKWNGTGGIQTVLTNGGGGAIGSPTGYSMAVESGVVKCWLNGVTVMVASGTLSSGQWTHLAFVRSSGNWSYYKNGVNFALTNSTSTPLTPTGYFAIGSLENGSTNTFDGVIDEVKIWNVARNSTQVTADKNACTAGPQAGLVGYWGFNEGTGSSAVDGSGNGNTLTLSNTTWTPSGAAPNTYVFWPGEGSFQSGSANQVHTYNTAGVYSSSVTVTNSGGCATTAFSAVTVIASPSAISGNTAVAIGSTTTLSDMVAGGTWSSSMTNIAVVDPVSGVVTGMSGGTSVITYSVGTACFKTTTVTVIPVTPAIALCAGTSITLTDGFSGGTWTSASNSVATVVAGTGVVTGAGVGTPTTTLIKHTLPSGVVITFSVTVNPISQITYGSYTVCQGQSTTYINSTFGGGTWSSSNTGVANVIATGKVTGVSGGTSIISFTTFQGCVATKSVTVYPALPVTGIPTVCAGQTTLLANSIPSGTWSTSSASIATVAPSGLVTGAAVGNTGVVNITYTTPKGCATSVSVTVNPLSQITYGSYTVCQGQSTTYINNTFGGGTWTSSNTTVANVIATGKVTGVGAGSAIISFTSFPGCIATKSVTVYPSLPVTGTQSVCAGQTTALTNMVAGGTWTSSSNSIATVTNTGVVTGGAVATPTSVNILYTTNKGCVSSASVAVNPISQITYGSYTICQGQSTTYTNTTYGGGNWSSSNTAVAFVVATGVVTGIGGGTATISFTSLQGCIATKSVTVYVAPAITGATAVCVGQTASLSNTVAGGTWSSGNPATATITNTGIITGVAAGSITVRYTLPTGCIVATQVTVNPLLPISGPSSLCEGSFNTFYTNATPGGGTWSSSNTFVATVNASGAVTAVGPGVTTLSFTTVAGCVAAKSILVNAVPPITGPSSVCQGESIALNTGLSGGVWNSSTPSVATVTNTGVVLGYMAGSTVIRYVVTSGCSPAITITVNPLSPIVGPSTLCEGSFNTFYTNATPGGGIWSSSNTFVATVNASGAVTAVGPALLCCRLCQPWVAIPPN